MKNTAILALALSGILLTIPFAQSAEEDGRQLVTLPENMKTHTLANMRDHLHTLEEIQSALAKGNYDAAADMAEQRLGMNSLESHQGKHMAPFRPDGMNQLGWDMHKAASRFALVAQESAVDRDLPRALGALSEMTQQCVACHAAYRLK